MDDTGSEVAAPGSEATAPETETAFPPLPDPPDFSGRLKTAADASRIFFKYANRWLMVPFHRAGLAAWLGTPLTGWQCLITSTGRKSGVRRHTPLGYLVADGSVWVLAGYGPATLWYRNLLAEPAVEVLLPGRAPLPAHAREILDPAVRARIVPALVRSMALPGGLIGCNPLTATDERILGLTAWVPLIRLEPDGSPLVAGPDDPGGLGWIWRQALLALVTVLVVRSWRSGRRARAARS